MDNHKKKRHNNTGQLPWKNQAADQKETLYIRGGENTRHWDTLFTSSTKKQFFRKKKPFRKGKSQPGLRLLQSHNPARRWWNKFWRTHRSLKNVTVSSTVEQYGDILKPKTSWNTAPNELFSKKGGRGRRKEGWEGQKREIEQNSVD